MSKKKKKSLVAENLIESLMDDLKDIQAESSYNVGADEDNFDGLPVMDTDFSLESEDKNQLWGELEKDIDVSEFTGGANDELDLNAVEESEDDFQVPDGFGDLPPSEQFFMNNSKHPVPAYDGPSADGGGYQSSDDLFSVDEIPDSADVFSAAEDDATKPVGFVASSSGEDKTVSIQQDLNNVSSIATSATDADKTIAVEGFANAKIGPRRSDVDVKVSVGNFRGSSRGAANVLTSVDASLAQAENLKFAQQRILELEKEVEHLRAENEDLASAGEIIRNRTDELTVRVTSLEKEKEEIRESAQSEILILKGNLQYKENEVAKARIKVEELDARLKSDFKKIRVRERELENRLELLRAEKSALIRSKDEYILEQKRKIDQLSQELDNYRQKCLELNKTIEANQDQVKRTERALRLALTNLEAKEENVVPLKKAE